MKGDSKPRMTGWVRGKKKRFGEVVILSRGENTLYFLTDESFCPWHERDKKEKQ